MRPGLRALGVAVALALFLASSAPQGSGATPSAFRYISLTPMPPDLPTSSGGSASYPALVVSITNQQGERRGDEVSHDEGGDYHHYGGK
ncbi:MAG: hypothetical protein JRM95_06195, partial [Nitrososphaerota archaeon]|nr:hypothetical protein [Nitrososphaerota archaeon]